jgi:predicted ATP-grasp superfamily ATP-dependent carboligase
MIIDSCNGSFNLALSIFLNCQPDILTKFNNAAIKKHQITKLARKLEKMAEEKRVTTVIHNPK